MALVWPGTYFIDWAVLELTKIFWFLFSKYLDKRHEPPCPAQSSYIYMCVCVCVYVCICIYVCMYMYICICIYYIIIYNIIYITNIYIYIVLNHGRSKK